MREGEDDELKREAKLLRKGGITAGDALKILYGTPETWSELEESWAVLYGRKGNTGEVLKEAYKKRAKARVV